MSDSVRHHRRQPTRLPHPWDSPGKNTGVGCLFLRFFKDDPSFAEPAGIVRGRTALRCAAARAGGTEPGYRARAALLPSPGQRGRLPGLVATAEGASDALGVKHTTLQGGRNIEPNILGHQAEAGALVGLLNWRWSHRRNVT